MPSDGNFREELRQRGAIYYNRRHAKIGTPSILPRLRVRVGEGGACDAIPRGDLAPTETNNDWWAAVMRDFRVNKPKPPADPVALSWFHEDRTFVIACDECKVRCEFLVKDAIGTFGRDHLLANLKYDLSGCPKRRSIRQCNIKYALGGKSWRFAALR
jgi:hypothetical protein